MKLAVVGSRSLTDLNIGSYLSQCSQITEIVSGGASGVDSLAEGWAKQHGIPVTVIRPEYDKYGKQAPLVRNFDIIREADFILAIWDGRSRGTMHAVSAAKKANKPYRVIEIQPIADNQLSLF